MEQTKTPSTRRIYTKNTPIRLTSEERAVIEKILEEENPPFYNRLTTKLRRKFNALLLFDEGKSAAGVAAAIGVTLVTIHSYAQAFVEGGLWKLASEYPAMVEAREKRQNKLKEINPEKWLKEQGELERKRRIFEQVLGSKEEKEPESEKEEEQPMALEKQAVKQATGKGKKSLPPQALSKEDVELALNPTYAWQSNSLLALQEGEKEGIDHIFQHTRMTRRKRMFLQTLLDFSQGKSVREIAKEKGLPTTTIYKYGKAYMNGKLSGMLKDAGLEASLPQVSQLTHRQKPLPAKQPSAIHPAKPKAAKKKAGKKSILVLVLAKEDIAFLNYLQEEEPQDSELSLWANSLLLLSGGKSAKAVASLLKIPVSKVNLYAVGYQKGGIEKEKNLFAPPISLSKADKATLEAAYKKPSSNKRRALLIKGLLLLDEGNSIEEVAGLLKVTKSRIGQWISKYAKGGLSFLNETGEGERKRKRIPVRR